MRHQELALCLLAALAACSHAAPSTDALPALSSSAPLPSATAAPLPSPRASAVPAPPVDARPRTASREGSTVALARTGDALYVADEDHASLQRLTLPLDPSHRPLPIPMPGQPAQVLALEGRILVTIRSAGAVPPGSPGREAPDAGSPAASATGPGLLLVLRPDAGQGLVEIARVELPEDAWGVAVTPDAALALVTSAWTHRVSAVDLATCKVRWTLPVAREPRAVVVRADGLGAYVTHLTSGKLTRIDNLGGPPRVRSIDLTAAPLRKSGFRDETADATLAYAAVLSPDGRRLFVPRQALGALGRKAWFGASSVDVLLTRNDASLAPARRDGMVGFVEPPSPEIGGYGLTVDIADPSAAPDAAPVAFAQPRAAVYLERRRSLLVLGEGSDSLTELDALAVDPAMHTLRRYRLAHDGDPGSVATDCGAPSGIALSPDERTAWIHCRSTGALLALDLAADDKAERPLVRLAEDLLPPAAALGRRLFYNGTFDVTSGGLGCAGCHPEGRDDGQVWLETNVAPPARGKHHTFVSASSVVSLSGDHASMPTTGPDSVDSFQARQTPMLAGRVSAEGPYGWHGESATLVDRLLDGFALHRWDEPPNRKDGRRLAEAVAAFLRQGLVPPPRAPQALTAREQRGRAIFLSDEALCWTCHTPDREYTDRASYAVLPIVDNHDLGEDFTDHEPKFKTPSLRFVAGTPPYFHDGSAPTLADLVEQDKDTMGKTSHLSDEDKAALVAFLETL